MLPGFWFFLFSYFFFCLPFFPPIIIHIFLNLWHYNEFLATGHLNIAQQNFFFFEHNKFMYSTISYIRRSRTRNHCMFTVLDLIFNASNSIKSDRERFNFTWWDFVLPDKALIITLFRYSKEGTRICRGWWIRW